MAAARLSSAISSADLISRASSMICWPSTTLMPAFCISNIIAGSTMSTPTGIFSTPASFSSEKISLACFAISPNEGAIGAAQAEHAGLAVLRRQPGRIEPVMHGGGAEVPQDRLAVARQQRPARNLVALPFADLGRGDVADVVDVEDQQRAALGILEHLLGAAEAVAVQAAVVDALLEIDPHDAERGQRTAPIVARVDVLGADLGQFARSLVHGVLLVLAIRALGAAPAFSVRLCADRRGARKGIGRTAPGGSGRAEVGGRRPARRGDIKKLIPARSGGLIILASGSEGVIRDVTMVEPDAAPAGEGKRMSFALGRRGAPPGDN